MKTALLVIISVVYCAFVSSQFTSCPGVCPDGSTVTPFLQLGVSNSTCGDVDAMARNGFMECSEARVLSSFCECPNLDFEWYVTTTGQRRRIGLSSCSARCFVPCLPTLSFRVCHHANAHPRFAVSTINPSVPHIHTFIYTASQTSVHDIVSTVEFVHLAPVWLMTSTSFSVLVGSLSRVCYCLIAPIATPTFWNC